MRPKKVILIVDDNEQQLSELTYTLKIVGFKVLSTSSPQEAIEIFTDNTVDLVITDMVMPKIDGSQLSLKLKSIASHIPIIILGDAKKMAGIVHNADALLHKPAISSLELIERIKIMSARKRGPRPGTRVKRPSLTACLA